MKIVLIAALSENYVVGSNNMLPWHLPGDLKYFKRITTGKAVIMGRKTYESIGRPLPNRTNIVISRNPDFRAEGVKVVASLEAAIRIATDVNTRNGVQEVMIIGGASIYEEALPMAERLYLTHVHAKVKGGAYFPKVDFEQWSKVKWEDHKASADDAHDYSFAVYDKK